MNQKAKKTLGIILGLVTMIFAGRYFLYSYRDGNPKWFMIVMVCGMLLILYYTVIGGRKADDEDYS